MHTILGAAVGTPSFVDDYLPAKVEMWKEEMEALVLSIVNIIRISKVFFKMIVDDCCHGSDVIA